MKIPKKKEKQIVIIINCNEVVSFDHSGNEMEPLRRH
jgi:hypothetical protein